MEKHHEFIRDMDPNLRGVFLAFVSVMTSLTNEVPGSRDRIIAYLLDVVARMDGESRSSPYGLSLISLIEVMENTQFPDPPSDKAS